MSEIAEPRLLIDSRAENLFARLPADFHTRMAAEKVGKDLRLIHANEKAAALIGLDPAFFRDPAFVEIFSGRRPFPGGEPLAMVYSGHQFGGWAGQLGDGRALLIAQIRNARGELWDVQLKGSGLTPYSRFGDGRAVMRSTIREYLGSEAVAALGVPSSRALSIVATGEQVRREELEPGAILTRLARSHIRFGHFEHFHYAGKHEKVRLLAEHVIEEYFPAFVGDHAGWFGEVVTLTARLMAEWQAAGFAHGVMNTDNMSILGLTLDYGPYGFMDAYDPEFICNHSDEMGRYSFINQPLIAHWNLRALALTLTDLVSTDVLLEKLNVYEEQFGVKYRALMRAKLGLAREEEGDDRLIGDLLALMAMGRADYTLVFRGLPRADRNWLSLFHAMDNKAAEWLSRYRLRTEGEDLSGLELVNPAYVLRNWVAETVIRAVEDRNDIATLDRIFNIVRAPFEKHDGDEAFAAPPPSSMCHLEVSCSS